VRVIPYLLPSLWSNPPCGTEMGMKTLLMHLEHLSGCKGFASLHAAQLRFPGFVCNKWARQ
jgi:hypothetical protein